MREWRCTEGTYSYYSGCTAAVYRIQEGSKINRSMIFISLPLVILRRDSEVQNMYVKKTMVVSVGVRTVREWSYGDSRRT